MSEKETLTCKHCGFPIKRWGTSVPPRYTHPFEVQAFNTQSGRRRTNTQWCPGMSTKATPA